MALCGVPLSNRKDVTFPKFAAAFGPASNPEFLKMQAAVFTIAVIIQPMILSVLFDIIGQNNNKHITNRFQNYNKSIMAFL
jgi:hypothetical protein